MKSGCRVEDLANETAERLRRAIAINLIIAWRIMRMSLLGRETSDLPADVLFSDIELKVLNAYAKKNWKSPTSLGEAILIVAKIGGYLNRPSEPPPGHQIIWRGLSDLQLMCHGFDLNNETFV